MQLSWNRGGKSGMLKYNVILHCEEKSSIEDEVARCASVMGT